jgi:hypothetical protein
MAAWKIPKLFKAKDRSPNLRKFEFGGTDVRADIVGKYGPQGDLLEIYATTTDTLVHKWHHYLPIYERYFGPWRHRPAQPLRFLEIGVSGGGSLAMWRRYFGPEAIIFGIDINPACAAFNGQAGQVRIGSQDDADFLRSVVAEMGGIDVVLDDGSHVMAHVKASLQTLFPLLSLGGTYMIEDLHTAYSKEFGGGFKSPDNFFDFVRASIDDMHQWYHGTPVAHPELALLVAGLHLHDSIVVLDKAQVFPPIHSRIGKQTIHRAAG